MSERTARHTDVSRISADAVPSRRIRRHTIVVSPLLKTTSSTILLVGAGYHAIHTTLDILSGTSLVLATCVGIYLLRDAVLFLRSVLWTIGQLLVQLGGKFKIVAVASALDILLNCQFLKRLSKLMAKLIFASVVMALFVSTTAEQAPQLAPSPIESERPQQADKLVYPLPDYAIPSNFHYVRVGQAQWPKPRRLVQLRTDSDRKQARVEPIAIHPETLPLSILPNTVSLSETRSHDYSELPEPIVGLADSEVPPILTAVVITPCLMLTIAFALQENDLRECMGQSRNSAR